MGELNLKAGRDFHLEQGIANVVPIQPVQHQPNDVALPNGTGPLALSQRENPGGQCGLALNDIGHRRR